MKPTLQILGAALLCGLLCTSLRAQAPSPAYNPPPSPLSNIPQQNPTAPQGPVAIGEEPHHRLVLQNDFTHVYNVMVPPLDATLLHQHDFPYLYVTLGPADIINAIVGKPELHQVLQDGETHYSPGHFAHIARTDSGVAFHNITIELIRTQGTPTNLCKEVLAGSPLDCPVAKPAESNTVTPSDNQATGKNGSTGARKKARAQTGAGAAGENTAGNKEQGKPASEDVPYFETDEIRVDLHKVSSANDYVEAQPNTHALLVALTDANLDANLGGEHIQFLHGGDALWMPAGQHRRIVDFLGTHSSFLLISFKDSAAAPKPQ
jgi:hypothetical protein